MEKVGYGKGVCLPQCSTETPNGRQKRGTLTGRGNSGSSFSGYLEERKGGRGGRMNQIK